MKQNFVQYQKGGGGGVGGAQGQSELIIYPNIMLMMICYLILKKKLASPN